MKLLILGMNGQLGKAVMEEAHVQSIPAIGLGRKECDITNKNKLIELINIHKPTHIINCAGYVQIDAAESEEGNKENWEINVGGQRNVIEVAQQVDAYVIYPSTDYVFDSTKQAPHIETDPTHPLNNYGKAKLEGEQVTLHYSKGLVLRTSWLYGKGTSNFIHKFLEFTKTKDVLPCTSDEVSVPTSTTFFSHVLMESVKRNLTGLYHAVPRGLASRADWARKIVKLLRLSKTITECSINDWNSPAKRSTFSAMASSKLQSKLGIAFATWEEDLEKFI